MDEIPTPEWAISALLTIASNLHAEGQHSRADALTKVAMTLVSLVPSRSPSHPPKPPSKADLELCGNCSFTFAGHIGNTGCVYPCWTPSGLYLES